MYRCAIAVHQQLLGIQTQVTTVYYIVKKIKTKKRLEPITLVCILFDVNIPTHCKYRYVTFNACRFLRLIINIIIYRHRTGDFRVGRGKTRVILLNVIN